MVGTTTDTSGWYDLPNIPLNNPGESYVLYVDIPGYTLDSAHQVVVDSNNLYYFQLNYYVDSNTIWIDTTKHTGILIDEAGKTIINNIKLFPNPSNGDVTVRYELEKEAHVVLSIYNVMGVQLEEFTNTDQVAGKYQTNMLLRDKYASGMYFVIINVDGQNHITRLIISK